LNIVFDLGGVVFNWQPDDIVRRVFSDPEIQQRVKAEVFGHPDWVEFDRGTISLHQAIAQAVSRTGMPRSEIERLLDEVPLSMTVKEETVELIRSIHGSDNRLFVLSNMPLEMITYLEEKHDFWDMFEGLVFSSRIKMVKPEAEIFEHLLTVHQLAAPETIFIDDMSENVSAASAMGIRAIRFDNAAQCKKALLGLKCVW
jgi:putative hydrolase of the HAD superfamily